MSLSRTLSLRPAGRPIHSFEKSKRTGRIAVPRRSPGRGLSLRSEIFGTFLPLPAQSLVSLWPSVEADPMAAGQLSQDDDLLRRVAAGDEQAFTTLYRAYQGLVYRFAMQMSGNAMIAEEATQEVFVALMRQAAEFDPSRGRLSSWLYGIARKQVLRQLDRRSGLVGFDTGEETHDFALPPELTATFDPIETLTRKEQSEELRGAIVSLPPHYREAIVLCDLHEMSYAEAAAVTGCAVGTVRSRLHRARTLLRSKLAGNRRSPAGGKVPQRR